MEKNCIFCKISLGETTSKRIYENSNFFSILDINQDIPGHGLIVSKKHFNTILDVPKSLGMELLDCIKKTSLFIIDKYHAEGFNILNNNFESAGQLVKHFHLHIFPRKKDDEIKVIG